MRYLPWLTVFLLACGASSTRPEAMSAKAHERAAEVSEAQADQEDERFSGGTLTGGSAVSYSGGATQRAHAAAHRRAAKVLRHNERAACEGISDGKRAACPLMEHEVLDVRQTPKGVRVLYDGVDPDALRKHVICHHAFGAREGREGMPGCPLYARALRTKVEAHEKGATLDLESDDEATVKRVRSIYEATPAEKK